MLANRVLDESGLPAATLLGVTLGNINLPSIEAIRRFKEYAAILPVSAVFILLTADLSLELPLRLDWGSVALLGAVLFVVRPLSILLSTRNAGMTVPERDLLAWIAPRGIVAAAMAGILGPELSAQGYEGAELLLPLVFALILVTALAHGLTIGPLGRRFGLSAATPDGVLIVGASPWTAGLSRALEENAAPVIVVDNSWHRLGAARLAGVKVFLGEILAEESEQQLELNDYGCLLAATEADACNALVCSRFAERFGRTRVCQLPDHSSQAPKETTLPRAVRGLATPADDAWFENRLSKSYEGWRFHTIPLADGFGFDRWTASVPAGSMAILGPGPDGAVLFNSPEQPVELQSGDKRVWHGPQQAERRRKDER